ncbi:MAG: LLM class flavin-dependent oxidoreductase [Helicobacteraceae bacterium]|jgi:FMN-dependent oxidoreductase (nitrilotriacetate monooxygenase family)|nr:LLM class flavin-dependent oxidoreductase [Helicobacteraceae bacterium]
MSKKILFNAFIMDCASHQTPGLWAHPRNQSWRYKEIDYWIELAKIAESGYFAAIFIADVIGYYDVYGGDAKTAVKNAVQIPINDPLQIAAAAAAATKHIGFGVTASTAFEHPYVFARRIATADHYTKGRVGWNIVTSYLESGAKNVGDNGLNRHDDRYEVANEYLEVIYKLLEGSWEDGAIVHDREKRVFADPNKVHEIGHKGKYFEVPGIALTEPSPQRTPVLFQAGASEAGKKFAARHVECVFVANPSATIVRNYASDVRALANKAGRDAGALKVFSLATIIVDETDEEARAKYEEYKQYISYEGALALVSGWIGIDLSGYQPDEILKRDESNAIVSILNDLTTDGEKEWTPRKLAEWIGISGLGALFIGSPVTVADAIEAWVEKTGVDGLNIGSVISHETFADVVKYLVPELQKRGVYPTSYADGTLREKIFGRKYLPDNHPAAQYRDIEKAKKAARSDRHG